MYIISGLRKLLQRANLFYARTGVDAVHGKLRIEPVIGHLKQDHRMKRNYLQGQPGDQINALLVGSGFNLRKLLRVFFCLLFGWPEQELELKLPLPAAA